MTVDYNSTALIAACMLGNSNMTKLLLSDSRVDINLQRANGDTALHVAAYFGSVDIVEQLLESKALNTAIKNNRQLRALDYALTRGHKKIACLLQGDNQDQDFK